MNAKLLAAGLACLLVGFGPAPEPVTTEEPAIQGTWRPMKVVYGDRNLVPESELNQVTVHFGPRQLEVMHQGKLLLDMKYTYHVNQSRSPATFDMMGRKGEKAVGIFRFQGDELILVLVEGDHPRPTDFANPPEFMAVLKRIK